MTEQLKHQLSDDVLLQAEYLAKQKGVSVDEFLHGLVIDAVNKKLELTDADSASKER